MVVGCWWWSWGGGGVVGVVVHVAWLKVVRVGLWVTFAVVDAVPVLLDDPIEAGACPWCCRCESEEESERE